MSLKASWSGFVVKVSGALGIGVASRGAGEPTIRPRLAAGDNIPAPWPTEAREVEGWGEWSLARPWPPGPGRRGVDSIRLIITGTARRKSGIEEIDGLEVAALVVAVEVVVVVVFMMKLMLGIRITEWTGVRGITTQIRQREACLSLRTTLYCHDPTPRNPTRHHTEAWRIPIEPPVLTVPTHTGSLLTKSCGSERFLTSGLWLPVQVARPL